MILHPLNVLNKVLIVGDIHGCLREFQELLQKCSYSPQDTTLILVGDLVNKGPCSAEVVRFARSMNALCVRGNHDESVLSFAYNLNPKQRPEAYSYIDSMAAEDLEWLRELPYTISIPSYDALVVHAGLVPGRPLQDQHPTDMHSMRNVVTSTSISGTICEPPSYEGVSTTTEGVAWASLWRGPHVYFGHDAKRGLQQHEFATGLDTGCCYGE